MIEQAEVRVSEGAKPEALEMLEVFKQLEEAEQKEMLALLRGVSIGKDMAQKGA